MPTLEDIWKRPYIIQRRDFSRSSGYVFITDAELVDLKKHSWVEKQIPEDLKRTAEFHWRCNICSLNLAKIRGRNNMISIISANDSVNCETLAMMKACK